MTKNNSEDIYKEYIRKPWYLQPILIAILFAGSIFIFPLIAGIALLIIDHIDSLKKKELISQTNFDKNIKLSVLEKKIEERIKHNEALDKLDEVKKQYLETKSKYDETTKELKELTEKMIKIEEEVDMQDAGFYGPEFDLTASTEYKTQIINLQKQQKDMVKNKTACKQSNSMTYNGSLSEGRKMVRQSVKMNLWSFNTHCDSVISKVTYRNRDLSQKKILKAFDIINSNDALSSISNNYLQLKLQELNTTFQYKEKLEQEKELLREQREQEREERKLQREIALERAKIEKDETHVNTEIARLQRLLLSEKANKQNIQKELSKLENKLNSLNKHKEDINFREAHAKAGYVYIISNIGAFGKDIVKIGVTRRLEPIERVNELGDASVPFRFDTHALIFSEDAYKLEKALHDRFAKQRLNQINHRKEFFRVPLEEVRNAIVQEFNGESIEFRMQPDAMEFKQTLARAKAPNVKAS